MSRADLREVIGSRLQDVLDRSSVAEPEALAPGALVVLPKAGETPELWAIIEHEPTQQQKRLRVVPADLDPRIGSGDVATPADAACGALSVRCRFPVWLPATAVAGIRPAMWLDNVSMNRITRMLEVLDAGGQAGDGRHQEVDEEPEYRDLEKALAEACERLVAAVSRPFSEQARSAPSRDAWHAPGSSRRRRWMHWPLATAAGLALIVGFFAGQQTGEDGMPLSASAVGQVPHQWLNPVDPERTESSTTSAETLELTVAESKTEARFFSLILAFNERVAPGAYQLMIFDTAERRLLVRGAKIQPDATELTLLLDRGSFPDGAYRLELEARESSDQPIVYRFRISTIPPDPDSD